MTFEEYFEWEKKNVIYVSQHSRDGKYSLREDTPSESNKEKKNTTISNCSFCGAPVNSHKEKCDYCDCYY